MGGEGTTATMSTTEDTPDVELHSIENTKTVTVQVSEEIEAEARERAAAHGYDDPSDAKLAQFLMEHVRLVEFELPDGDRI